MARYEYDCPVHGAFDRYFPMGEAPTQVVHTYGDPERFSGSDPLDDCRELSSRVYGFYHQEDRRHMRQGISHATGKPFAQSRDEERAIEKSTGIYFAGKNDLLPHEREAVAYSKHVASGGERVENPISVPTEKPLPLTHYMDKMGYKRREYDKPPLTADQQQRQFEKIVEKHG